MFFESLETRRFFTHTRGPLPIPTVSAGYNYDTISPQGDTWPTNTDLREYLVKNEGDLPYPYLDSNGLLTIGVGINIDPVGNKAVGIATYKQIVGNIKLSDEDALAALIKLKKGASPSTSKHHLSSPTISADLDATLFNEAVSTAYALAQSVIDRYGGAGTFVSLNNRQQIACVDMAYNMGYRTQPGHGFNSLHVLGAQLAKKDWVAAAAHMGVQAAGRHADNVHLVKDTLDHFDFSVNPIHLTAAGTSTVETATPRDNNDNLITLAENVGWTTDDASVGTVVRLGKNARSLSATVTGVGSGTAQISVTDALWDANSDVSVMIDGQTRTDPNVDPEKAAIDGHVHLTPSDGSSGATLTFARVGDTIEMFGIPGYNADDGYLTAEFSTSGTPADFYLAGYSPTRGWKLASIEFYFTSYVPGQLAGFYSRYDDAPDGNFTID